MKQLNFEDMSDERTERKLKKLNKKSSKKNATTVWTDAGYAIKSNIGNKVKVGRVAWKIGRGKFHVKTVKVPEIEGLTNYSNLMELIGVMVALEATQSKNILIITDSKIAMAWTKRKHNDLRQFSEQHYKTKERIDKAKKKFDNFNIKWVPRESNIAGIELEKMFK